jgi:hypothetical protein
VQVYSGQLPFDSGPADPGFQALPVLMMVSVFVPADIIEDLPSISRFDELVIEIVAWTASCLQALSPARRHRHLPASRPGPRPQAGIPLHSAEFRYREEPVDLFIHDLKLVSM